MKKIVKKWETSIMKENNRKMSAMVIRNRRIAQKPGEEGQTGYDMAQETEL